MDEARARAEVVAFDGVFDRHHARIWRFLARLGGRECADELAGEVFVRAYAKRGRFDPTRGSIETWLYAIALNLVRDRWRRQGRAARALARLEVAEPAHEPDPTGDADDLLDSRDRLVRARLAMAELAEHERDVLVLAAWEGLSYEAIAEVLGVELGTVRSRLSRARARLRELVDGGGVVPDERLVKEPDDG